MIGEKTAEEIKMTIGSAYVTDESIDVCGRNLVTGLPSEITIESKDVHSALSELFQSIVDAVKIILGARRRKFLPTFTNPVFI